MRLAFPIDGGRGYAGAVLRQTEPDGPVSVELQIADGGDPQAALRQVARAGGRSSRGSTTEIQRLKGLGPFYAGLVVLRAGGFADAMLLAAEPRLLGHAARFYGLPSTPTLERFTEMADAWRPFRTWVTVLIRLAGNGAKAASAP